MNWLNKLRIYLGHDEPTVAHIDRESSHEAVEAYERAQRALVDAQIRKEAAHEVTMSLATLRVRNHFGESIAAAMRPKEKPV